MTREEAVEVLKERYLTCVGIGLDNHANRVNEAIDMAIESLSAETEWIPVSERLPKVGQDVLFCDGKWTEEGCMMEDGDWCQFRWSTFRHKEDVTAWMPLPTPYGERKEE